jgi:hypothetical protein
MNSFLFNSILYSVTLIMLWFLGDMYKFSYYISKESPKPLILCAAFQVCTDIAILIQFKVYSKNRGNYLSSNMKVEKFIEDIH